MNETYIDGDTDRSALTVQSSDDDLMLRTTNGLEVRLDRVAVAALTSDLALWLGGDQ